MNIEKQETLGELLVKKGVTYIEMGKIVIALVNLDIDKPTLKALGESLVEFTKEQKQKDEEEFQLNYPDHSSNQQP